MFKAETARHMWHIVYTSFNWVVGTGQQRVNMVNTGIYRSVLQIIFAQPKVPGLRQFFKVKSCFWQDSLQDHMLLRVCLDTAMDTTSYHILQKSTTYTTLCKS